MHLLRWRGVSRSHDYFPWLGPDFAICCLGSDRRLCRTSIPTGDLRARGRHDQLGRAAVLFTRATTRRSWRASTEKSKFLSWLPLVAAAIWCVSWYGVSSSSSEWELKNSTKWRNQTVGEGWRSRSTPKRREVVQRATAAVDTRGEWASRRAGQRRREIERQ